VSAPALPRRAAFALLAAPPVRAATSSAIPRFPDWVGRTALLRVEGGAARVLLSADGTGIMSVRVIFVCRTLPIRSWNAGGDGLALSYRRVSALDSSRTVTGEARILTEERQVLWIEAQRHLAEFVDFADADAVGRCS